MERFDRNALAVDTVIAGAYRIVRPIAGGGMGLIYEVEQIATGARRALKVMHGAYAADPTLRSRFVREARLAVAIPSDHIAFVLDAGQDEASGALFIVMELLDGTTLSRELRRVGAFPWPAVLSISGQICHALAAAHERGIVHRDLKPANVFLARSRNAVLPFTVKLLDFGIAKAMVSTGEATGVVLGTPSWMAPEQTTVATPIGPQADVWSLGLLVYMMVTGRHYFITSNAKSNATAAILREVIFEPLVPASVRAEQLGGRDALPPGFDAWFARCVDRAPEHRFPDARTAYEAFARLPPPLASCASPPPSSGDWTRSSIPPAATVLTVVDGADPLTRASRVSAHTPPPPERATSHTLASRGMTLAARRRMTSVAVLVAVGLVAALAALSGLRSHPRAVASAPLRSIAPERQKLILRLAGSNTIGLELAPALAEAFLARRTAKPVVRQRTAPDELLVLARDADRTVDAIEIRAHGTTTAFEALGAGTCDIGMASRRIHDDEAGRLEALGDLTSAATEHVIALDGISVIVNPSNPVASLTKAQVADVFAGAVQTWSDLGGSQRGIVLHARDDKSGTWDTFKNLVLGGRGLAAGALRHESSQELSDAVAADPGAIGFIGLPYVRSAKSLMVEERGSLPVLASPLAVATEEYPLSRRLYLYAPFQVSIVARDFIDFALSDEGQRVVQTAGFIDLRPTCDPNAALSCAACTPEYRDAVRGACRVSLDFRFEHATTQLDTRALRDLPRLVAMMQRPELRGRSLVLLGFSEPLRARAEAIRLSQERVDAVASQLRARGERVEIQRGLGGDMRVADEEASDGRERNRRVEVWVR